MLKDLDLLVLDFDGVLNISYDEAGFLWPRALEADLGLDPRQLEPVFSGERFARALRGKIDILDVLAPYLAQSGLSVETLWRYWQAHDLRIDPRISNVVAEVRAHGVEVVIGTNSDARRARHLAAADLSGATPLRVLASAELGAAKPDQRFFVEIEACTARRVPERILLVDDWRPARQAARGRGWRTIAYGDVDSFTPGDPAMLRHLLGLATLSGENVRS